MKEFLCFGMAAGLAAVFSAGGQAAEAADGAPSLTLYNQAFAVVREKIPLTLEAGVTSVDYDGITAHLEPSSVILRDAAGKLPVRVLEQNYQNDPLSQGLLLQQYEGKTIQFLQYIGGEPVITEGRIIRAPYVLHEHAMRRMGPAYANRQMVHAGYGNMQANAPVIEVNGRIRFSLPGEPLFPDHGEGTNLKPTLRWQLEAPRAAKGTFELSYVSGGFLWSADYNLILPQDGSLASIIGWVTMENQSGRTFENASIKLMAGDVSKIEEGYMVGSGGRLARTRGATAFSEPVVEQKSFDEYHLYTLQRPSTLRDRETRQVEFVRAEKVTAELRYIYNGAGIDWPTFRGRSQESLREDKSFGTQSNPKVWVYRIIQNTKENNLGLPLPKGRVRFYRQDADGALEFVGENEIDHTPRQEELRVYTGDAFDILGTRKRTDFQIDTRRQWLSESFEIEVRNRKEEPIEVHVVEDLYRWVNWTIPQQSQPHTKTDSQQIEFLVPLKPDESKTVSYTVEYTW